jgi:hypothetical protein
MRFANKLSGLTTIHGLRFSSVLLLSAWCAMAGASASQPAKPGSPGPGAAAPGSPAKQAAMRSTLSNLPLSNLPLVFEPNRGQTDPRVSFLARGGGYTLFLTRSEAVVALSGSAPIRIRPSCAQEPQAIEGLEPTGGISNYFIGNDPARWTTNVPNYRKVQYTGVCPGVDVTYYGNPRKLEYDFTLSAWTDPGTVQVEYEGAESVRLAANGDLVVKTASGELVQHKPRAYQVIGGRQVRVEAGYRVTKGNRVEFAVARYNRRQPLVIDPVLVYSTYLGGSGGDTGSAIALDTFGNAYVTGHTLSSDFPTVNPPFQGNQLLDDAFVAKISANGATKVYATYLGGGADDLGLGIAVDTSGNAYVTGQTHSVNFPLMNPFQGTGGGVLSDAFVTKLNASGSALLYSTYLGGSGVEQGTGIAVDNIGNAYVTGSTSSGTDFPHTANAFQTVNHSLTGLTNAFVTKLNTTLTGAASLVYSTYLGGTAADQAFAIAVDRVSAGCTGVGAACACVTGSATSSVNFPVTPGSFQTVKPSAAGLDSAFVTKLNPTGTAPLIFSTYLGGSGSDVGHGIAVDTNGNAYVTGATGSVNFPTKNPIQVATGGGLSDAFVTKLNPALAGPASLIYSTYLGGLGTDVGNGIAVDSSGTAYVVGTTGSSNFPVFPTVSPLFGTGFIFVSALNPAGTSFAYSTYLSGGAVDQGLGIAAGFGNAYVTGQTTSTSFPILNAVQPILGGGNNGPGNAFVTVISLGNQPPTVVSGTPASATTSPQTFAFTARDPDGSSDIANVYFLVNTSPTVAANTCHGLYNRATNALFLYNDALTLALGPLRPGSAGTLQNSQCVVNGIGSSVTVSGTDLVLNLNLGSVGTFANGKNVYLLVTDNEAHATAWVQTGTWTLTPPQPPVVVSGTPVSATVSPQTFAFTARDPNGFSDIANVYFLVNTTPTILPNTCHGLYNRATNALFLYNDALTAALGPLTPGSAGTLANSQCVVNGIGSSVTASGTDVILNLNLGSPGTFVNGGKNVYLLVTDNEAHATGWVQTGTWTLTAVNPAPTVVSGTPAIATASPQTFAFTARDPNGFSDIANVYFLVNGSPTVAANTCHGLYNRATNALFLYNDTLTVALGPLTPGSAGSLANSQCVVNGIGSSVTMAGTDVMLNLNLGSPGTFVNGGKNVYLFVTDNEAHATGWVQTGTWTLTAAQPPTVVSGTPAIATVSPQTFAFTARDPNGFSDIANVYFLVNTSPTILPNTCHGLYNRATNALFLYNDTLTLALGPLTPGTAGTLANSQCVINGIGSSVAASGTDVVLNLNIASVGIFAHGAKNVYLLVTDNEAHVTGWVMTGTWNIP